MVDNVLAFLRHVICTRCMHIKEDKVLKHVVNKKVARLRGSDLSEGMFISLLDYDKMIEG